ncbi:hypothetical protein JCM17846_15930 [Iodidimonas nitroreducens]|uniref:DUF2335 domain-containing protein n=1 Tax=Iodidimonas nitroreducens TaxID=1236968 RepID=A0A5A7N6H9_9PROT|nr:DUF2335 domain-containing protein [Iodidimonas nitroreducens]GAK33983.1 putative membrane protein [alpha proteobacterium Q-1]GER03911.1 hypothetical protein JCM17846_15930 [Iodidimonas nitroreducens]
MSDQQSSGDNSEEKGVKSVPSEVNADNDESADGGYVMLARRYKGPIPPPDILEAYNDLVPGAAAEIIANWGKESDHRRDMERLGLKGELAAEKRGQYLGAFVALFIFAMAFAAGWFGMIEIGLGSGSMKHAFEV